MERVGDHGVRDRAKRIEHDDVEAAIDFLAKRAERTAANPAPVTMRPRSISLATARDACADACSAS